MKNVRARAEMVFDVTRAMSGADCGEFGIACYGARIAGVSPEGILGIPLWEGAQVRVTVELLRQGRKRRNPWLKHRCLECRKWMNGGAFCSLECNVAFQKRCPRKAKKMGLLPWRELKKRWGRRV